MGEGWDGGEIFTSSCCIPYYGFPCQSGGKLKIYLRLSVTSRHPPHSGLDHWIFCTQGSVFFYGSAWGRVHYSFASMRSQYKYIPVQNFPLLARRESDQREGHSDDLALRASLNENLFFAARAYTTSLLWSRSSGHPGQMTWKQFFISASH